MNANQITSLNNFMSRQMDALKQILELIGECEDKKLLDGVEPAELQQLKSYTGDMMLACSTTTKLAKNLENVVKAAEEDKKKKDAAEKKAKVEKKEAKKPAPKPESKKDPEPEPVAEDDDMSWLE